LDWRKHQSLIAPNGTFILIIKDNENYYFTLKNNIDKSKSSILYILPEKEVQIITMKWVPSNRSNYDLLATQLTYAGDLYALIENFLEPYLHTNLTGNSKYAGNSPSIMDIQHSILDKNLSLPKFACANR
jgi:hypothetical protein